MRWQLRDVATRATFVAIWTQVADLSVHRHRHIG